MSFDEIVQFHADENPDSVAVTTPSSNVKYADIARRVRNTPLYTGRTVALDIPEPDQYITCFIAAITGGARVLPILPSMPKDARDQVIRQLRAICVKDTGYGFRIGDYAPGDLLHFTSGSTGASKLVIRSHANLIDEATSVAQRMLLTPESKILIMSPLEHSFGCGVWRASIMIGANVFPAGRLLSAGKIAQVKWLAEHWATHITGVPYAYRMLLRSGPFPTKATAYAGGERLTKDLVEDWQGPLYQEYGLSEGGIAATGVAGSPPESIGTPIPRVFFEIDPESDELIITRPHNPTKYLDEETYETFHRGMVFTGDTAMVKSGQWYITGRLKDMINVAGRKVVPSEIENVMLKHEDVDQAVVVSWHDGHTERPALFYSTRTGNEVELRDIRNRMTRVLDSYKVPRNIHYISEWPRTLSGKIDKTVLRGLL